MIDRLRGFWKHRQTGSPASPLTLLAALGEADRVALRRVAGLQGWRHYEAGSVAESLEVVKKYQPAVVLCDREIAGGDWREAVRTLTAAAPCCLILASRVADTYLWQEVVQCGGYDVVGLPLQVEQVTTVIHLAWRFRLSAGGVRQKV